MFLQMGDVITTMRVQVDELEDPIRDVRCEGELEVRGGTVGGQVPDIRLGRHLRLRIDGRQTHPIPSGMEVPREMLRDALVESVVSSRQRQLHRERILWTDARVDSLVEELQCHLLDSEPRRLVPPVLEAHHADREQQRRDRSTRTLVGLADRVGERDGDSQTGDLDGQ
jgi:hypothetical protein